MDSGDQTQVVIFQNPDTNPGLSLGKTEIVILPVKDMPVAIRLVIIIYILSQRRTFYSCCCCYFQIGTNFIFFLFQEGLPLSKILAQLPRLVSNFFSKGGIILAEEMTILPF